MTTPTFETITDARGVLIRCTYDGEIGAARVFDGDEQKARERAEAQARAKAAERDGTA